MVAETIASGRIENPIKSKDWILESTQTQPPCMRKAHRLGLLGHATLLVNWIGAFGGQGHKA